MSTFFRSNGLVTRICALPLALLCFAGLSGSAGAQVAPTLLPYNLSVIAGGATANPAAGATCPASGFKSTDAYGDGCLATEVLLASPRFVTTDKNGVVYFTDTLNLLVRRIDPLTGVITTVAGGASSNPSAGTACGTGMSTDLDGDGCPATLVHLSKPMGLAFSPAGDLYFSDNGFDNVRKVNQTTGIITTVIGQTTFGYNVNNTAPTGTVNAATQGYTNFPYGIVFDKAGNLYIADEGNQALIVVNLGTTSQTIQGLVVPAGTVAKFAGYGNANTKTTTGDCPDFTAAATGSRGGCYFGSFTDGNPAVTSGLDNPYDITMDPSGNVYFNNWFNYDVGKVTPGNIISNFAGIEGTKGTAVKRGAAGSFGIGNNFNVAADYASNVYLTDNTAGVVYRVDAGTLAMYPVAGGAAAVCAAATDKAGDGCPATQAILTPMTGTGTASYQPGAAGGIFVDPSGDLLITDTTLSVIRMAASGTYFGAVGANQPTQTVAVHFAAADPPASNPFTITSGSANFTLGAFNCAPANSDGTIDCTVSVTATPATLGAFTGTLTATTSRNAKSNFTLSGNYVSSRLTRTTLAFTTPATCVSSTVATTTPVTLTATVVATGTPTGTVTFFANGTQIGTPQTISNAGKATLVNTFSTVGTYAITAKYSGDTNFNTSTSSVTTISSVLAAYAATIATAPILPCTASDGTKVAAPCVNQGQTALYSFNVAQTVYSGTITFACSNLPANATCVFSPATLSNTGCTVSSTVALSILTQQAGPQTAAGFGTFGRGPWQAFGILPGVLLALYVGIRRRKSPLKYGQIWMALALLIATSSLVACGNGATHTLATPPGTYAVTVTASGSVTPSTAPAPLTVSLTVVK